MNIDYKFGLVSISFRQHTPEQIIEAVANAGLSCIEWGSDIHAPCTNREQLIRIAELQGQYGIECSSYGTYFRLGVDPTDELPQYIKAAKLLGTDVLRLWCGNKNLSECTESEKEALLDACEKAERIAREQGVVLCMECHHGTLTENPADTVMLMERISSPHFRMYWQPFQWCEPEQNIEYASKICKYTEHIHVFNWKSFEERYPLGDAHEVWQKYLSCFDGPRTLLLEYLPHDRIEDLPREALALKSISQG